MLLQECVRDGAVLRVHANGIILLALLLLRVHLPLLSGCSATSSRQLLLRKCIRACAVLLLPRAAVAAPELLFQQFASPQRLGCSAGCSIVLPHPHVAPPLLLRDHRLLGSLLSEHAQKLQVRS